VGWLIGALVDALPLAGELGGAYVGRDRSAVCDAVRARDAGCRSTAAERTGAAGLVAGAVAAGARGSTEAGAADTLFSVSVTAPDPAGRFTSWVEAS